MEAAAGVLQHVREFATGVGTAYRDRTVVARDAAAVDGAIQLRETVVKWSALEVIDDDGDACDALSFRKKAHDLLRLQMMEKETAGDDIDAYIGERKVESIALDNTRWGQRRRPRTRVRQVDCACVQQCDIRGRNIRGAVRREIGHGFSQAAKAQQRSLEDVGAPAGHLEDVRAMLTRCARERLAEQAGVQPHSAEALVYKGDGMERGADLLRGAAVLIQPFFLNNSFHGHNSYRTMTMP